MTAVVTRPASPLPATRRRRRWRDDPLVRAVAALDPDPVRCAVAVLYGSLSLGCAVGLMAVSGWLISRAAQHPPVLYLEMAVVATRAFGIGRGVLRYAERLASHDVALRGVAGLRERLYVRLTQADPSTVAGLRRGDLLARVGADVDALADLVIRSLLPFAVALTTVAASAGLVAAVLPGAGLVVAAGLAVAAVIAPWLAATAARRAETDAARTRSELSAQVLALLDGVAELTVAQAVDARLARLRDLDDRLAATLDRAARPAAVAAFVSTAATGLAMVGALVLGVQATAGGRLGPVLLAVVALTPLAAAEAVAALPAAATGLVRSRAAATRVLELLDAAAPQGRQGPQGQKGQHVAAMSPAAGPQGRVAAISRPHLVATDLACGWPGHEPVLTGFDLDLPPGRRVAVVGASGGGKTTLLLTLAGLLPARSGCVTVNGTRTDDLDEATLRRTVSFVAEDAHVFTTTIRENLRVADPDADDDEVLDAVQRAGLRAWVDALPAGLDTLLGSGGTGLSGGERRRLLLARALLTGAGVLLFDEPGEHLDPATADALIRDVLFADANGPAVVVVTHRLAPLAAADEVVVLESGRVSARGTHEALLRDVASYREALRAEAGDGP
jgi:ATP-binding cassette subfamily C protein CydC